LYADVQAVLRTTQMHVDKLQLQIDTVTRERVSSLLLSSLSVSLIHTLSWTTLSSVIDDCQLDKRMLNIDGHFTAVIII